MAINDTFRGEFSEDPRVWEGLQVLEINDISLVAGPKLFRHGKKNKGGCCFGFILDWEEPGLVGGGVIYIYIYIYIYLYIVLLFKNIDTYVNWPFVFNLP